MNNIFEGAYFGKPYRTRDGRKALFITTRTFDDYISKGTLIDIEVEGDGRGLRYTPDGKIYSINMCKQDNVNSPLDIVSEWQEPIVIRCQWKDYYDYRIMMPNGEGHVRLSFFGDETIISDLYVSEEYRREGYATILLDKVDELLEGKKATIVPLEDWHREWYQRRGYLIGEELSSKELNKMAKDYIYSEYQKEDLDAASFNIGINCYKAGYLKK